jgi:signal peptidase I
MDPLTLAPRSSDSTDTPHGDEFTQRPNHHQEPEKGENFILEIFKFAVLALVIVVPFRMWIAQPFIVSGASMSPTFETGQYLIIDQLSYRFEEPKRGDVIVFRFPNDPSKYFIKRIIGLPGEIVSLDGGETSITDPRTATTVVLPEDYLVRDRTDDDLTITLSTEEYFVMGDNRGASSDSRVWGPVPKENIIGKPFVRLLPPDTIGIHPGFADGELEHLSEKN